MANNTEQFSFDYLDDNMEDVFVNLSYEYNYTMSYYNGSTLGNKHYMRWNFYKVLIVILSILGLIGNSMCIAILAKRNMRYVTTYKILLMLAISDIIFLFLTLLNLCLFRGMTHLSLWHCVTFYVVTHTAHDLDNILIVLASFALYKSSACCCRSGRRCNCRSEWYFDPCFSITLSFLVLVTILNTVFIAIGAYNYPVCHYRARSAFHLVRQLVMVVTVSVQSCIYLIRIARQAKSTRAHPESTQNHSNDVISENVTQDGNNQDADVPLRWALTVFVLLASFFICEASFVLWSVMHYLFHFYVGITVLYIVNFFYYIYFCGKVVVYIAILPDFRRHLTSCICIAYNAPRFRRSESNEAFVLANQ